MQTRRARETRIAETVIAGTLLSLAACSSGGDPTAPSALGAIDPAVPTAPAGNSTGPSTGSSGGPSSTQTTAPPPQCDQPVVQGSQFHVSPSGTPAGDGSVAHPWDLQTALHHPAAIKPGDTIWLHAGVHRLANRPTKFDSTLAGTAAQPITVRQYPGERATVDGNLAQYSGGWVIYRGFEIMNSTPNRSTTESGPFPTAWWVTYDGKQTDMCVSGVDLRAQNVKMINLVVHDSIGGGFGINKEASGAELYGSLSYYNGWQGADRGHGHGLYLQNAGPNRTNIDDDMFFMNYALGLQATGSGGSGPTADYLSFEGDTFFENGQLALQHQANFLVGAFAGGLAQDPVIANNSVYDTMGGQTTSDTNIGYDNGTQNANVHDNYFGTIVRFFDNANLTLTNNTFVGGTSNFNQASYASNTYLSAAPTGLHTSVRPNKYEAGRGTVVVYNWDKADSVQVDVSALGLKSGDQYELRNAQDYFTDVVTGTFTGGKITVPMSKAAHTMAKPGSHAPPASTFPEFGAFVMVRRGCM